MEINWHELTKPLDTYKWKVNSSFKSIMKVGCVPYFDARDVEDRLDEELSPALWQDEYYQVKDTLFCKIGILVGNEWVWKSGAGVEKSSYNDDQDIKLKGEASDAFKLAAIKWGIFRDVYKYDMIFIDAKENSKGKLFPVDEKGKEIKQYKLTDYITSNFEFISKNKPAAKFDKKPDPTLSKNDQEKYYCDVLDIINSMLGDKKISKNTADILTKEAEEIQTINDFKLITYKTTLIELFLSVKSFLSAEEKNTYHNNIMNCTLSNWKSTQKDLISISKSNL